MSDFAEPERPAQPAREGLPSSYRMRADRHYVDLLASRTPAGRERVLPIGSLEAPRVDDVPALVPLIESVRAHGVLQPLLVFDRAGSMRVIAGHRRLAAAIAAGLREVPCIVHDVDDETAERLRDASNVSAAAQAPIAPVAREPELQAGDEIARALATAGGLADLMAGTLAELTRGAIGSLLRAELWRAAHLLTASRAVREELPGARGAVTVAALVDKVVQGFAPERRMRHVELAASIDLPPGHIVVADERLLSTALTGGVVAMLALLEGLPSSRITIAATISSARLLTLAIAQEHVRPSDVWVERAFDREWRDRPGGVPAAVAMAAMQQAARAHGGEATAATSARGARVALVIPAGA